MLVQNAGGRCAGAREAGAGCYSRFLGDGDRVAGQTSSAFGLREMAFRGSIHSQAPAQALDSLKQAFAAPRSTPRFQSSGVPAVRQRQNVQRSNSSGVFR